MKKQGKNCLSPLGLKKEEIIPLFGIKAFAPSRGMKQKEPDEAAEEEKEEEKIWHSTHK
jgi:hypothetical protein